MTGVVEFLGLAEPLPLEPGCARELLPRRLEKLHVVCDVIAGKVLLFHHRLRRCVGWGWRRGVCDEEKEKWGKIARSVV